jgi:hypothetical protein
MVTSMSESGTVFALGLVIPHHSVASPPSVIDAVGSRRSLTVGGCQTDIAAEATFPGTV